MSENLLDANATVSPSAADAAAAVWLDNFRKHVVDDSQDLTMFEPF